MSTQYVIKMQVGNKTIDCVPMHAGDKGLGLDENGMTWMENTPVRIEVAHDELNVSVTHFCTNEVSIIRNGRTRRLCAGQCIRLLKDDELRLGDQCARIEAVYKQKSPSTTPYWQTLRTASRAMMMSMATALILSACSPKGPQTVDDQLSGAMVRETRYDQCKRNSQDPGDIKSCCLTVNNDTEKADCCEELKSEYQISCEDVDTDKVDIDKPGNDETQVPQMLGEIVRDTREVPMGDVALSPYGICMQRFGTDDASKLRECCMEMPGEIEHDLCCNELKTAHPGTTCDTPAAAPDPVVHEKLAGAIKRDPYVTCKDSEGDDAGKLKKCCLNHELESDRRQCCQSLTSAHPGTVCEEEPPSLPERTTGKMVIPVTDPEPQN